MKRRSTKTQQQNKRKSIAESIAGSLSLSEKYGLKSLDWQPPAIITKHLQNLNDDSVLMDAESDAFDLDPVLVTNSTLNERTIEDVFDQIISDEKVESSNGDGSQQSEKPEDMCIVAKSPDGFQASPPLFDSDSEDFEFIELSDAATNAVADEPCKMIATTFKTSPLSSQLSNGKTSSEEQRNDKLKSPVSLPIEKNSSPVSTPVLHNSDNVQLTGNIVGDDFVTKLCRLKTIDEMINLSADQTQRVDQLMVELFSMSEINANLLDQFNTSLDELLL